MPAQYEISGDVTPVVGSGNGVLQLPLVLSTGDGVKVISWALWTGGHASVTGSVSIVLDTTAPTITISSHSNHYATTGSTITLTGTVYDNHGIATILYQGNPVSYFS